MRTKLLETLCVQGLLFGTVHAAWFPLGVGDCRTSSNEVPIYMERGGTTENECKQHCDTYGWCQGIATCRYCTNQRTCLLYVQSIGLVPATPSGWRRNGNARGTITGTNSTFFLYHCSIFTRNSTSTRNMSTTSTTHPRPSNHTLSNSPTLPNLTSAHTATTTQTTTARNATTSQMSTTSSTITASHVVGPRSNATGNTASTAAIAAGVSNSTTSAAATKNISTSTVSMIATNVAPFMHLLGYGCCRHDTGNSPPNSRFQGRQTEQICKDMCAADPACIAADLSSPVGDAYVCVTYYGSGQNFHTQKCSLNVHQRNTSTRTTSGQALGPSNSTSHISITTARQLNTSTAAINSQAVRLSNSTSNINTTTARQLDTSARTTASQVVRPSNSTSHIMITTTRQLNHSTATIRRLAVRLSNSTSNINTTTARQLFTSATTTASQALGPGNSTSHISITTARQLNTSTAAINSQAVRLSNSTSNINTTAARQLDISTTTTAIQGVGLSNSNSSSIATTTAVATGVNDTRDNDSTTNTGAATAAEKCFLKVHQLRTSATTTTSQVVGLRNSTSTINTTTTVSQVVGLSNNTASNITTIASATGASGSFANTITTSKVSIIAAQATTNTTRSNTISTTTSSPIITSHAAVARTSSTTVEKTTISHTAPATTTRTTMSPVRSTLIMGTSTTTPGPTSTIRGSFEILASNPNFVNDPDAEQAVRTGTADAFGVALQSTFVTLVPSSGSRRLREFQERSRRLTTTAKASYNLLVPSSDASDVAARIVSSPMVSSLSRKIADAIANAGMSQAYTIQVTSITSPSIDGVAFRPQGAGASPQSETASDTTVIVVVIAVACLLCCVALLTAIYCGWRRWTGQLERNKAMQKPVTLPIVCVEPHESGDGQTGNKVQAIENEAASLERSANELMIQARSLPEENSEAKAILVDYVSDTIAEPFALKICTAPPFHPSSAAG